MDNFFEFCIERYTEIFDEEMKKGNGKKSKNAKTENERFSQKKAIRDTMMEAMRKYNNEDSEDIWKAVYAAHMHRKTGISDAALIQKVVSSENSWKKSSGHAFEEMIQMLGDLSLTAHGIEILLQKDLKNLIAAKKISNEAQDIIWLNEQIKSSSFDLYITVTKDDQKFVYGCIQSKTSIRDRVSRDREPSMNAMNAFFWSTAICLDGDFLRLPKFISMVNGGTTDYIHNGWHGLYVFSDKYTIDRIYPVDIDLDLFMNHAIQAAEQWLQQRQWFNNKWKAN